MVAVPESVVPLHVMPLGSDPENARPYAGAPPDAEKVTVVYAVPD